MALLNPELVARLTDKEREQLGADLDPAVERLVPGGIRSAAHLGSRGNMQELFREMLLPGSTGIQAVDKDGKPVLDKDGNPVPVGAAQPAGSRLESVMTAM